MEAVKALWYALRKIISFAWMILRGAGKFLQWCYHRIWGRKGLTTHGDASWATDKQLKKAGAFKPGPFLLLQTESGKEVYGRPNRGVTVLAGPGQGKSQFILANFRSKVHLPVHYRQHLVVHDPADELYRLGKPILESLGYLVAKIDLVEAGDGIRYDIQSFLKPGGATFDSDLRSLCEHLVEAEPGSRQPHFVEYARKMLQDVIVLNLVFEGGKRSLSECIDELLNDKKRDALIKRMKKYPHDFNAMGIFDKMSGPEGVGMLSTALRKLDPWTMENIRRISEVEPSPHNLRGWSFEEMLNSGKPCVLFVRTGLAPGGGDFARVVFANFINTIRREWDSTGLPNPRGMQAFIDEAAKLGRCEALVDGHNELRKANYSQFLSYVSFSAMEHSLGRESAATIMNGCDHIILPGNQDMATNEKYSAMIGEMTIESGSTHQNNYGDSKGKSEQAIRVVKADKLRREDYNRAFGIVGGLSVKGYKVFKMKKGRPVPRTRGLMGWA